MIMKENNWGDWGLMFNNINENNRDLLYTQVDAANVVNLAKIRSAFQQNANINNPYVDKTEISSNAMEGFSESCATMGISKYFLHLKLFVTCIL